MTTQFNRLIETDAKPVTVYMVSPRHGIYSRFLKRVFDIVFVLLTAPLALLLILIASLLVARDGVAPFYCQKRVGRGGRVFDMIKLQTMVPDADRLLQEYLDANPEAKEEWDLTQKLLDDPRITRTGRFLRRTSLDELPQLWNVLKGDMSIVGPRPYMIHQHELYSGLHYTALRPGITGLWQVSERNDVSFSDRGNIDDRYGEKVSLKTDLSILLSTVTVVLNCTGN